MNRFEKEAKRILTEYDGPDVLEVEIARCMKQAAEEAFMEATQYNWEHPLSDPEKSFREWADENTDE